TVGHPSAHALLAHRCEHPTLRGSEVILADSLVAEDALADPIETGGEPMPRLRLPTEVFRRLHPCVRPRDLDLRTARDPGPEPAQCIVTGLPSVSFPLPTDAINREAELPVELFRREPVLDGSILFRDSDAFISSHEQIMTPDVLLALEKLAVRYRRNLSREPLLHHRRARSPATAHADAET